jgi:hypothetical protein
MNLINNTKMQTGYALGRDPSGREYVVVVIMGTFTIPPQGEEPQLSLEQMPLVDADTFTGNPGLSAPVYEMNYALRKPRCDLLLNGTAYSPNSKPAEKVLVGLKVDSVVKSFNVVGDRIWHVSSLKMMASQPKKFITMPITYDRAFGGTDTFNPDASKHTAYMQNPIGCGYHKDLSVAYVDGKPLPNTEELGNPVIWPNKPYRPMSFGPVGRGWQPRLPFAGTYDQDWLDNTFPFLPTDFSDEYYQASPADLQMPYPKGGEEIILMNLTPEGRTSFRLPMKLSLSVIFFLKNYEEEEKQAVVDTVIIEPDLRRFMITWRVNRPLKKNLFEVVQVLVSSMSN